MIYGWDEKPTRATVCYVQEDSGVYQVGDFLVEVPGAAEDLVITYRRERTTGRDPRRVMPNIEIVDREIRIPVDDLVETMLERLDPVELAETLWRNEDVRSAFIRTFTEGWGQDFTDAERRKVLHEIKDTVHDVALDKLTDSMGSLEFAYVQQFNLHDEVRRINGILVNLGVRDKDGRLVQLTSVYGDPTFRIGGVAWVEARDYWRAEVKKNFLPPEPLAPGRDLLEEG